LRRLGLLWGLGLAAVFIPVVHLVLVPGLLLAGPVGAVLVYRRQSRFEPFSSTCPVCGQTHTFDVSDEAILPQRLRCPVRDRPLVLKDAPPEPASRIG